MLACWCLLTRPAFGSQAGNVMQSSRSWVCVLKDFLVSDALPWMPSHTARVRKSGSKIRLNFLSIALLEDVRNYLKSLEGWCRALSFECQAVQMIIYLRVTTTWRRARERPHRAETQFFVIESQSLMISANRRVFVGDVGPQTASCHTFRARIWTDRWWSDD